MTGTVSLPIPKPVQPVKIREFDPERRRIKFDAVGWVAGQISQRRMGKLFGAENSSYRVLIVNELYDFNEVLLWLQSLEAPSSPQAA